MLPDKYKDEKVVYEDDKCISILATAIEGHVKIFTKTNNKLIDDLDEEDVVHLFYVASFAATAAFESLGMQGTNIIVNNEEDVFCIDVIPRKQDDALKLNWDIEKGNPVELDDVASKISEETFFIGKEGQVKKNETPKELKTVEREVIGEEPAEELKIESKKEEITEKVNSSDNEDSKTEEKKDYDELTPEGNKVVHREKNYLLASLRRIP